MEEMPFSKITIGHICEKCGMNRKSFYYHFKDKYDLVNRIFYTDFIVRSKEIQYTDGYDFLLDLCTYLRDNKSFYRKVLKYDGQNSFMEYFKDFLTPYIEIYVNQVFKNSESITFYTEFFTDAVTVAVKKWIIEKESTSAEEFAPLIHSCFSETIERKTDL